MLSFVGSGVAAFLLANTKVLPGVWHCKVASYFIRNLYFGSKRRPKSIFESQTYRTFCPPLEVDMYAHKSNSTYGTDLDFSRLKLLTYQFRNTFRYHNTPGMKRHYFEWIRAPVASTNVYYVSEIKPFQRYNVRSRIFGWDRKWIFVLTAFESKHGLHAYALSKFVLKQQRKTVPPVEALEVEGLLNEKAIKHNEKVQKFLQNSLTLEGIIDFGAPGISDP